MVESSLIYAVARDITEQKRNQALVTLQAEELARSNADLEQFAYVASHDLRAPLRSIVTLAKFIEDDLGEAIPEKSREHLGELKRRALLMQVLTEDLLVYSQAGREPEQLVTVDVADLVRDVVFLLDPPQGFNIVTEGKMPVFETLRGPLEQVLRNLIGNAVKHHDRAEGSVTISSRDLGQFWELAVTDDGPGIAEQDHDRVFRVFQTLEPHQRLEDRGIGLSLVKRIVEAFGGVVGLDRGSGRGATFRFTWPRRMKEDSPTS